MGGTPNVTGMMADPDFQGLSLSDKRAALGKVTGDKSFASLSDADTMQFISKFPQKTSPEQQAPNALAQAQGMFPKPGMGLPPGGKELPPAGREFEGGNSYVSMSPTGIATSPLIPAKTQVQVIGAGLGGQAMAGLPGAASLPTALRMLGTASGAGLGAGAGTVVGGGSPKEALGTAAGTTAVTMAIEPLGPFLKWLTSSKTAGAEALQVASTKAGSAPVELSARTDELVDKLVEQSKLGGKPIKVISDLLERVGPSTRQAAEAQPGPLTYNEARILQGNISSLSAEEQAGLKATQKGLMKQLANSFSQDVQAAADKAGIGEEHAFGMKEFATASARNRALVKAGKTVAAGAGVYGAEQLIKKGIGALKP